MKIHRITIFTLFLTVGILYYFNREFSEYLVPDGAVIKLSNPQGISEKNVVLESGIMEDFFVEDKSKVLGYSLTNISEVIISPRIKINDFAKSSIHDMINSIAQDEVTAKELAILWTEYISLNKRWGNRLMANSEFSNPLLFFVNGGYGVCSDFSRAMAIALTKQGVRARVTHVGGVHAVVEVWFDESWHMFDPSEGVYFLNHFGNIASVDEILQNPLLVTQMSTLWNKDKKNEAFLVDVYTNYTVVNLEYADSFMNYFQDEVISYTLHPHDKVTFYYDWKDKNILEKHDALLLEIVNGLYTSIIKNGDVWPYFSRDIDLPHFINALYLKSSFGGCRSVINLEYSFDDKKTWLPYDSCQDGVVRIENFFSEQSSHQAFSKLSLRGTSLSKLVLTVEFQVGIGGVQPVFAGENIVQSWWPEEGGRLNFGLLYKNE